MEWLSKNYDKALLIALSVIGIAVAAFVAIESLAFAGAFEKTDVTERQELEDTGMQAIRDAEIKLDAETLWTRKTLDSGVTAPLVVSVPIIEREGETLNMLDPEQPPLRDPIPNPWWEQHGVPPEHYTRTDAIYFDSDDDGYSNLEEYEGGTDPMDSDSHPPIWSQIRLAERGEDPFVLRFGAAVSPQYQLTRIEPPPRKSEFVSIGDTFPPDGEHPGRFKILDYVEKTDTSGTIPRDVSELILEDTVRTDNNPFPLVLREETNRPIYYAVFVLNHKGKYGIGRVDLGETFALPNYPETVYTLKDVQEDHAIVTFTPEGETSPKEVRIPLDN